ncbi:MAG: class I SAM-dependent methyltransferase [Nocardioidaceae bacterium]
MDERVLQSRGNSFASVADSYDAGRPGYPIASVGWLVGERPVRVVDLAAGTGLFSEALVAAGHRVLALEPSEQLAARLLQRLPAAWTARASAERLPLARRCAEAVTVAQAFHWFDAGAALDEIARVLRPGGALGLVWNFRDTSVPWVARLSALLRADGKLEESTAEQFAARVDGSGLFTPVERRSFRLWQPVDRDQLLDLVRSRSYVATLDAADRRQLLDRVGQLYDDAAASTSALMLPYVTRCFRTRLRRVPRPPEAS